MATTEIEMCLCFSASDVDVLVLLCSQAELTTEIKLAQHVVTQQLPSEVLFYWNDRLRAYKLALDISQWYGPQLAGYSEVLALKSQIKLLQQKLYLRIAPKAVRGGIKL